MRVDPPHRRASRDPRATAAARSHALGRRDRRYRHDRRRGVEPFDAQVGRATEEPGAAASRTVASRPRPRDAPSRRACGASPRSTRARSSPRRPRGRRRRPAKRAGRSTLALRRLNRRLQAGRSIRRVGSGRPSLRPSMHAARPGHDSGRRPASGRRRPARHQRRPARCAVGRARSPSASRARFARPHPG